MGSAGSAVSMGWSCRAKVKGCRVLLEVELGVQRWCSATSTPGLERDGGP